MKVIAPNGRRSYPSAKAICSVIPYPRINAAYKEAQANATLISAAPDLLDAMHSVMAFFDDDGRQTIVMEGNDAWQIANACARAAISKATA
jgi:hypothetical protein